MTLEWTKSSYSTGDGPDCVEIATPDQKGQGPVLIRDSKDPARGHLTVAPTTWTAFLPYAAAH
ncbi:DUF397 domain-containing protein [Streptomyces sp. NPDC090994]|uniref:DUF397 domain-containing protein n=1 Tax=Streptomyces sp. NPDC090994 TaxID=3365969 RepID=UPI0038301EAE